MNNACSTNKVKSTNTEFKKTHCFTQEKSCFKHRWKIFFYCSFKFGWEELCMCLTCIAWILVPQTWCCDKKDTIAGFLESLNFRKKSTVLLRWLYKHDCYRCIHRHTSYVLQLVHAFVLCISLVRVLQMFDARHIFQSSLPSSLYWSPLEPLSMTSHWKTWSTGPSRSHSQSFPCNACYTQFDNLPAVTNVLYCCCTQGPFYPQFEEVLFLAI